MDKRYLDGSMCICVYVSAFFIIYSSFNHHQGSMYISKTEPDLASACIWISRNLHHPYPTILFALLIYVKFSDILIVFCWLIIVVINNSEFLFTSVSWCLTCAAI